ncbi:MAG TPA: hypothetical protein VD972_10890, partial [Hyalangium sp.]|nr:hypothetical protein [Hyalangium sp.]
SMGLTRGVQSNGVVVTLPDGGTDEPDAGTGEPDGGTGEPDGGTGKPDGGTGEPDGGTGKPDGGGAGPDEDGPKDSPLGWGCASAGGAGLPLLLGLIVLMLLARRRQAS